MNSEFNCIEFSIEYSMYTLYNDIKDGKNQLEKVSCLSPKILIKNFQLIYNSKKVKVISNSG